MGRVIDDIGARKADLAAIHIARKELGWDEDMYRDVLFAVCTVKSSAALDFAGRKRFLAHLRACGWSGGAKGRPVAENSPSAPKRAPLTAPQAKMWSLWQQLADTGLVGNRKMPALVAFAKRTTGVDRLEWLTWPQEHQVIEALKAWLQRGAEPRGGA